MKKILLTALVLLGAAGAFLKWAPISPLQKEPVYIAVAGPMKNARGLAMKRGVELYRDRINKEGGISGRPLELLYYDDENDPRTAMEGAEQIAIDNRAALVIGHYGNEPSAAAGKIYKRYEIPAITASASDQAVIGENEWYFRVIPGAAMEGAFVAAYIANVFAGNRASIVFSDDAYGRSLADHFTRAAQNMSLRIDQQWEWHLGKDAPEAEIEKAVQAIVSVEDPGVLFLATHAWEGAKIVTALKDENRPRTIIGSYAFARSFPIELEAYPKEVSQPGYYTSGILFTTPYMADFGGAKADAFNRDFVENYGERPSEISACYYDAIYTAARALEKSGIRGSAHIRDDRRRIRAALESFYSAKTAIRGVAGDIYFDETGGVNRHFAVGIWQETAVAPALVQYQHIADAAYPNLTRAILTGDAILAGGVIMKKIRMIFADIDEIRINEIDEARMTFAAEFDLNLFHAGDFDDEAIEFTNAEGPVQSIGQTVSEDKFGITARRHHLKGIFRFYADFLRYPFDHQHLSIRFRHTDQTSDEILFVSDPSAGFGRSTSLPEEWMVSRIFFYQNISEKQTSLGNPEFFDTPHWISYSRFNAEIDIERKAPTLAFSYFLVIISMVCILLYRFHFVPARRIGLRLMLSAGICAGSAGGILVSSAWVLKSADLTLPDICFMAIFILAGITLFSAVLAYRNLERSP